MGSLEVTGLTKHYRTKAVLNNVSFSVADGEFFVLLGPSGGGKSTILRLLCGIETPDAGRLRLAGRDITSLPSRDRNIGMVFQDYGLYPNMSVFENIAYGLEARSMPKDEVRRRAHEAAGKLGLASMLDRVIGALSGGEQQRVALARALAKDADLYLFDEPLSNLDPKLRAQARRDIVMVHRAKQKPTIYVTHDQNEALAVGDRIAIVSGGKLQQVGTAHDLIDHPANMFVAGFVGTPAMNLLRAAPVRESGQVRLADGSLVRLPDRWHAVLSAYAKPGIVLGIPPTAFAAPGGAATAAGPVSSLSVRVEDVEPLVAELVVTFKLTSGLLVAALFQAGDEEAFTPGATLSVALDGEPLCLFDPDTEQALRP